MRSPTISALLRWAWAPRIWVALLPLATVDHPARGADDATVEQVIAAWERRRESTKCFQYECELEQSLVKGSRDDASDGFAGARKKSVPPDDIILHRAITFSLSGEKIAYCEEGEEWDGASQSRRTTRITAAFDAVVHKQLAQSPSTVTLGRILRGGQPGDILTVNATQTALWLAFSPVALLERLGYYPEKMTVSRLDAFRDGHDCAELSIPRRNPSWRALIYVDRSRGYIPLQFLEELNGVVRREVSIQYVPHEAVGSRVSAWNDKWFNGSGILNRSSSAKVKRCSINQPLGDEVFTLEFPEGTHFIEGEEETSKRFVALADGERRQISPEEYGMRGPVARGGGPWIRLLLGGAGAVLILALVFVLRRKRERR